MSLAACFAIGWLALPAVALPMCGGCLRLFLESAFGICVGGLLQRRFGRTPPQLGPGGSCEATPSR